MWIEYVVGISCFGFGVFYFTLNSSTFYLLTVIQLPIFPARIHNGEKTTKLIIADVCYSDEIIILGYTNTFLPRLAQRVINFPTSLEILIRPSSRLRGYNHFFSAAYKLLWRFEKISILLSRQHHPFSLSLGRALKDTLAERESKWLSRRRHTREART